MLKFMGKKIFEILVRIFLSKTVVLLLQNSIHAIFKENGKLILYEAEVNASVCLL